MSEYKPGLHKEVSAIFNGVLTPNPVGGASQSSGVPIGKEDASLQNEAAQPPAVPPSENQNAVATKPPVPGPKEPPAKKPPAPSHLTPTKPKPKQTPKANTVIKDAKQAPWRQKLEQVKSKLLTPKPGVSATKQKVMVILVPVLFVALIFVFIRFLSTPQRKITGPRRTDKTVKAVAAGAKKVDWKAPAPYPTTLRDPMHFGPFTGRAGHGASGLIVRGIVYSKDNPCAVVGDRIVHQGDKILDAVVLKINQDSIEFEANGKKWTQKVQ